jgi:hypothetical protein
MEVRYCPRCGERRFPDARFCGVCGFEYVGLGVPEAAANPPIEPSVAPPDAAVVADEAPVIGLDAGAGLSAEPDASEALEERASGPSYGTYPSWTEDAWLSPELPDVTPTSAGPGRRLASLVFALGGTILVGVAVTAVSLGLPRAASAFAPVSSLQDLAARPADAALLAAALGAAAIALVVAALFGARIIRPVVAVIVLFGAGIAAEAAGIGLLGRIAYDASGAVLPGPVVWIGGAAAIVSAAFVAAVIRD